MLLSDRLQVIADMVDKCDIVADIGTDHAYIPIYLIKNGICSKAIASDINQGPIEKARNNLKREGLQSKIECRIGGGLSTIKVNEVQAAIIAGMGGNLITDIVEEGTDVIKTMDYCIVQPMQHSDVLRKYLFENGFEILEEDLCKDEGKYYEMMKIKWGSGPKYLEDIYYEISPKLIEIKHPMLKEYIEYKIAKNNSIIRNIESNGMNAVERIEALKKNNKELEVVMKCL
ncbi:tRNA (adenine(22)-N(1))-methyltransferase [Clostridium oryzae]|uniref:tRNA (Adenine(22)-N(1))-methyltransferase n=1 Tax=Clostridium oryzae TaxID=1450648 RepID=A0A1V4IHZ3_9CLOT|nr:class I SAM-dependent methyltransferase [Clostridium oryzae]OPJ59444.1 tRNA (adenine(22)-N(1))-methyltransferase [Clostridium oryzae]